jgi:hypothetical protein
MLMLAMTRIPIPRFNSDESISTSLPGYTTFEIPIQDPADPDATGKLQGYGPCGAQGPHCGSEKRAGTWNLDLDLLFWGRM